VNPFERRVRASVYASFRDRAMPPSIAELSGMLGASHAEVSSALHSLAAEHCVVLVPGAVSIWMAHPFSGVETDFLVMRDVMRDVVSQVMRDVVSQGDLLPDAVLPSHTVRSGGPPPCRVTPASTPPGRSTT